MIKIRNTKLAIALLASGLIIISSQDAHAASSLSLYNYTTNKSIQYTGQQVKYYLEDEKIDMNNTPGIIIDGTSLTSYYDVFANSDINVDYKYNSTRTSLTLTKGSKSIKYTLGSKRAYVNGKAVTLSVAPIKVKYKSLNVTKVLVPARFTAETFGYEYKWSSSTSTATIIKPLKLYYNSKVVNYTGTEGKVSIDGKNLALDSMPSIIINSTAMVRAKKVFNDSSINAGYSYNSTKKVLTLTKGDTVVKLTMGNPIANVNGIPHVMDTAPLMVKNLNNGTNYIMVPGSFVASYLGYDYKWNTTTKTSIITSRKETQESTDNQNPNTPPELGGDDTITDNPSEPDNETQNNDISIALPDGVDFSKVTHNDRYYENKFVIQIPGDYTSFYEQNPVTSNNSIINDISVTYQNNNTQIVVQTNKLQGYKLINNGTSVGIDIGNPRDIYQNIVVLDAGHGGTDPGASYKLNGTTIYEKDINFKIMYTLTKKYFNSPDSNIKVYYSRYNNTKVDLYERAAFAEKVGADLFVSLHMNAVPTDTTIRGTDVYYSSLNNSLTDNGLTSKGLASLFLNYLPSAVGTNTRSVREAPFIVIKENTVPAILIELGFMTNQKDLALMVDSTFQEKTAKAIYDTVNMVFEAYPTGR